MKTKSVNAFFFLFISFSVAATDTQLVMEFIKKRLLTHEIAPWSLAESSPFQLEIENSASAAILLDTT